MLFLEMPYGKATMMTPAQCRAARAMLGLEQDDLAAHAAIPPAMLAAFERGDAPLDDTVTAALRTALETAGILFIADTETSPAGGPGLRLSSQPSKGALKDYVQYPEFLSPEASTGAGG